MAEITREPGLNSGLPDQDGLDEGTRSALLRAAEKTGKPVVVGGVQDMQKFFGEKALDDSEDTVNIPPGETEESVITTAEHDALVSTQAGVPVGEFSDSNTKDELQAELDRRGIEYGSSDTKADLLDKLNG